MKIFLNEEVIKPVAPDLYAALEQKGFHERKGIAVAVNDEVISRSDWSKYFLKDKDKVTIITATQGG